MSSDTEQFLKEHRSEIVDRVKTVKALAEFLLEKKVIHKQACSEIMSKEPEEEQMRTVYKHLNSKKAFDWTLEWLHKHASHVIKDLEAETESQEPSQCREKRPRPQIDEAVDESDSNPKTSPDLKILYTMAKLEEWVCDPEISQKLIDVLEKKLDQGEMEHLEDYLSDKKLKKSLCLTAKDINEIRRKKDLRLFLNGIKETKFPTNSLAHFFEHDRRNASTAKDLPVKTNFESFSDDNEDFINHNADDLNSSGYGSSCGSSFNSNVFPHSLSNTDEELKKESCSSTTSIKNPKPKRGRKMSVEGPAKRRNEQYGILLCDWLMNHCRDSEVELSDCISIKNVVQHPEYPFFIAENVTVFKNPQTGEEQILVMKDEKMNSLETTSLIHYQMFVCDIQKTVVLSSKESKETQIRYDESEVPVNHCLRCILEVFAPALAVFKNIQKKERLDSYQKMIEERKENSS